MNKFLIVDGSSLLTTNYFALLPREIMFEKDDEKKKEYYGKIMHSKDGTYTNAIYGTFKAIKKIIDTQNLTHVAIVFDKTRNTFRRELYSDYKGNRKETQEPLKEQFKLIEELFVEMGIKVLCSSDYEADDYAGSLVKKFANENTRAYLLTKDHDYIQLIDEYTYLWMMQTKKEAAEKLYDKYYAYLGLEKEDVTLPEKVFEFTPILIEEEFGIKPIQIIDVKSIGGDSSDNIPGIKGISDVTATALLKEYKSALKEMISEADDDKWNVILDDVFVNGLEIAKQYVKSLRESAKEVVEECDKREKKKIQASWDEKISYAEEITEVVKEAHWLYSKFGDGTYEDIPGLCKIADLKTIEEKGWSLTPGAYVGVAPQEDDGVDFEERMTEIHRELLSLQAESNELMDTISKNLKEMGL